ncbi:hypothetical protein K402DRAFT_423354 [Aulographum hederae CBS 113979]|uniref:Uncharacterized protein n=1 Tax=Aulographum hederae CBS 113979 TaxID=1176131 RepID=A0A6G1GSL8_9PEZI|nr:hypothetical protein K402DRAFT_423354 [Aulographum hederae CBS 113979]
MDGSGQSEPVNVGVEEVVDVVKLVPDEDNIVLEVKRLLKKELEGKLDDPDEERDVKLAAVVEELIVFEEDGEDDVGAKAVDEAEDESDVSVGEDDEGKPDDDEGDTGDPVEDKVPSESEDDGETDAEEDSVEKPDEMIEDEAAVLEADSLVSEDEMPDDDETSADVVDIIDEVGDGTTDVDEMAGSDEDASGEEEMSIVVDCVEDGTGSEDSGEPLVVESNRVEDIFEDTALEEYCIEVGGVSEDNWLERVEM